MIEAADRDWDDLRFFLAVARGGTVRRAAEQLGSSHSTVLRHLAALEESLGVRLFQRRRDGYVLTAAGERARDAVLPLEERVLDVRRQVQGGDARLSGHVRLNLPDALLPLALAALPRFQLAHPQIELELSTATRFVDLRRGEADVAVRIASEPDAELVGRRVAHAAVGVYGSGRYARKVRRRSLDALDWLGWERGADTLFARWVEAHVAPGRVRVRLSTLAEHAAAIDAHLGVSLFACAVGDARPGWQRLAKLELAAPVWVLSHADLKTTARVRAVRDFFARVLSDAAPLIAGEAPGRRRARPRAR